VTDREQYLKEHLRSWLESTVSALEKSVDPETRREVLESCGRACACRSSMIADARAIRDSGRKIDEFLNKLSRETSGLVEWRREDETVHLVYKKCFCPLRREGFVSAPGFCDCSCGWIKEVFETATGKNVLVRLEETIGRGDPACKFLVRS